MRISYSKCNILHIGSIKHPHSYNIDDNIIATVDSVTDLGVIVDADLRFKKHINSIVQKANQRSALIKRSFISRNPSNLVRAFKTYVRPLLEYSSTAWSPSYITYTEHCSVWSYQTYRYYYRHYYADEKGRFLNLDF